ncbi:peptidoglycan DD-metalloendopeptidase family protein [Amedibacillus sp. YH-ame10]
MYSYTKPKKVFKRRLMVSLACLLAVSVSYLSYEYYQQTRSKDTAVFKEQDVPVLSLPDTAQQKAIKPFTVEAQTALEYFDGSESKVETMTKFEGVYRGNQGIDYTFQDQAFDVVACLDGTVSEVKEDAVFGKSVTIVNQDLSITYQSLSDIAVKNGDRVHQSDVIAKAGKNIYNKDLGNHLHIVVEKNGKIMDPKLMYDKSPNELK